MEPQIRLCTLLDGARIAHRDMGDGVPLAAPFGQEQVLGARIRIVPQIGELANLRKGRASITQIFVARVRTG